MKKSPLSTKTRVFLTATGFLFYSCFFGLSQTDASLDIGFRSGFTNSTVGEVYFWLASALLLFPGTFMIGIGLEPLVVKSFDWMREKSSGRTILERRAIVGIVFIYSVIVYRLLHFLVLQDNPVTDDEYSALFGGQILSGGHLSIPRPAAFDFFPQLYLFQHNGQISSFDWPGIQIFWALDNILATNHLPFSIAAATCTAALVYYASVTFGNRYGVFTGALLIFSPMVFSLSVTSHAHILSRGALAVGLVTYGRTLVSTSRAKWALIGLTSGFALICRPFETVAILIPVFIDVLLRLFRKELQLNQVGMSLPGLVGMLAIFAVFNYQATGDALLPPRLAPNELIGASVPGQPAFQIFTDSTLLLKRFGANFSYNLFMLLIWFLGPVGLLLLAAGISVTRFTRIMALSVLSNLCIAMFHDNYGLHIVGPIHYSECAVPLMIISVHGLERVIRVSKNASLPTGAIVSGILASIIIGLGTFCVWHFRALHRSVQYQSYIYSAIDSLTDEKSIVLAPPFYFVWRELQPVVPTVGSFVFEWRKVHPYLTDDKMILHGRKTDLTELKHAYPDRKLFWLRTVDQPPYLGLKSVE